MSINQSIYISCLCNSLGESTDKQCASGSEFHQADFTVYSFICRVGIYYQLVRYMKEHFGDDAKGRKKAFYFLPWHFNFFCRYRY